MVENAQTLDGNASAESECKNISARSGSTIAGAFQMSSSTFAAVINGAVAENSNLATQIVPGVAGQMDPAIQWIAAAEYLRQGRRCRMQWCARILSGDIWTIRSNGFNSSQGVGDHVSGD